MAVHAGGMPECLLLRSCARLLRMPPRATLTACSYLHEYHRSPAYVPSESIDQGWLLVTACIFLVRNAAGIWPCWNFAW